MLFVPLTVVLAAWTCADEDLRIRAHLEGAYAQLEYAVPEGLTIAQQQGRAAALERLRAYIVAGRFPRNRSDRPATPVFVDERDTHCAMGQLLSELGGDDVVQRVRRSRNLATVPVLADEPGLADWLVSHGMTPEEAALVQPTYFYCQPIVPCPFQTNAPVYDVMLSRTDGGTYWHEVPVRISRDAGVCLGEPSGPRYVDSDLVWPPGTVMGHPGWLADDGLGWVSPVDRDCAERPRLTEADRLADGYRACISRLAQRDPRWLAIECFHSGWEFERKLRCNPDGRYRAGLLPARGTMRAELTTWLMNQGVDLADAGIDPAVYDAMEQRMWELSDDGGMPLGASVLPVRQWDGGAVPLDQACVAARDAGAVDAGVDAGVIDAGVPDAGELDAGPGVEDAGTGVDGGADPVDAGTPASSDAGSDDPPMPVGCGCASLDAVACALALLLVGRRRASIGSTLQLRTS